MLRIRIVVRRVGLEKVRIRMGGIGNITVIGSLILRSLRHRGEIA